MKLKLKFERDFSAIGALYVVHGAESEIRGHLIIFNSDYMVQHEPFSNL